MAITTYAELQTAVGNWLNRSDLTTRIPEFIELAEAAFNRDIVHHRMIKRSQATMDTEYTDLPDDWLSAITVRLTTTPSTELTALTVEEAVQRKSTYTSSGKPQQYAIVEDTIWAIPTPDSSYTVEMVYRAKVPALTDSNTSNWLLSIAPDLYLFGSLVQANEYVMDEERSSRWLARYNDALASFTREAQRAVVGGTPVARIKPFG
jgi:hypothetical protein